jgi:hypothetical protein
MYGRDVFVGSRINAWAVAMLLAKIALAFGSGIMSPDTPPAENGPVSRSTMPTIGHLISACWTVAAGLAAEGIVDAEAAA